MNKHLTPEDIRALSIEDRLQLIEQLWDSLDEAQTDTLPVPTWHEAVVDERLAAHERDPTAARPWADTKADILARLHK